MNDSLVRISSIADTGDERGCSFCVPDVWNRFLSSVSDLHITTIRPGHVRGNHYHARHKEILIVVHQDRWSLHWDSGSGTASEKRVFTGTGAVVIEISPLASHAIVNDGAKDLLIAGISDSRYNPDRPDAYPRPVA
jgi:oxalate decarboxylase/phosphoglucose isomerase-like protein (cupin superfamily)